ncbi:hypothetical protein [Jannaschia sp. M317]|uniref:hypothetical protein n=1 Tax=Jannaschia sp. M317 TaxID=2867011 RepID=UPI0021A566C8|nr:hypothetical protein [Jannaschia sp. M317]UWQ16135.1 hypothetical protein K3551_09290 [Jannaschia sp. M317]
MTVPAIRTRKPSLPGTHLPAWCLTLMADLHAKWAREVEDDGDHDAATHHRRAAARLRSDIRRTNARRPVQITEGTAP